MAALKVLQGHDGPIEIDQASRSVKKRYLLADGARARAKAQREADRAARFHDALDAAPGLHCPKVLACELGAAPSVTYELCAGEALQAQLLRRRWGGEEIAFLADRIGDGLRIYLRLFGEAYHDLHLNNLLYDPSGRCLSFLDFDFPDRLRRERLGTPLEASLANLVGCACYELSRPSMLLARKRSTVDLVAAILSRFAGEASPAQVCGYSRRVFLGLCLPGSAMRGRYYGLLGERVARWCLARVA